MYESNAANKSKYILIFPITSSYPPDSWDSWLVDSGAMNHFFGYKEVLSNLIDRESNLKMIIGDNYTHPVIGFGSVKLHLHVRESIFLHDVVHVQGLKKNLVSISTLEHKGMSFSFIKGKVVTWHVGSPTRDYFTKGYRYERLYSITRR